MSVSPLGFVSEEKNGSALQLEERIIHVHKTDSVICKTTEMSGGNSDSQSSCYM